MKTFKQTMTNHAGFSPSVQLNNGLSISATCWTDDPETENAPAFFDIRPSWNDELGQFDRDAETDAAIETLRQMIERECGGHWVISTQTIEQSESSHYKITVTNSGNHIHNPLLRLANLTFDTRRQACEAICDAMYEVIDGDTGCEMVEKPDPVEGWEVCDEEEWCNWAMLFRSDAVPTQRDFAMKAGFDNADTLPNSPLPTTTLADYVYSHGGDVDNIVIDEHDAHEAVAAAVRYYNDCENYADACREYIFREGRATEDGVSAIVEEVR